VFDFQHPMYVKMFRFLAEMAAEYITYHVRGRLHAAKDRVARQGKYTGGSIPIGFIVDRRQVIIVEYREVPNPTYKKLIPYEPHAQIVRWLFRRFCELNGNIGELCRELEHMPYLFPDFTNESLEGVRRLKRVPGGFHVSREGLIGLLSNPVYIGWWIFQGEIHSKTNHEPLVQESLFWFAFRRLAEYMPDGKKTTRTKRHSRFVQHNSTEPQGLLKDVITSSACPVYTRTHEEYNDQYVIFAQPIRLTRRGNTAIAVQTIDRVFEDVLFEHLRQTHTFDHYREFLDKQQEEQDSILRSINDQLKQVALSEEHILDNLAQTSDKALHAKLEERFTKLQTQKAELLTEKARLEAQTARPSGLQQLAEFHTELEKIIPVWHVKSLRDKRSLINALVHRVVLDEMTPHWLQVTIEWVHPEWGVETFFTFRRDGGKSKAWKEEELALLREHYPKTDRETILSLFPTRSWYSINSAASDAKIVREVKSAPSCVPGNLSLQDYQFMQEHGIEASQIRIPNGDTQH